MSHLLQSSLAKRAGALAWVGTPPTQASDLMGHELALFEDSDDFLLAPAPFDFDLFVIRTAQRGVSGLDLVRLLRRRSAAGILALSSTPGSDFVPYLDAGADMVLDAGMPHEHLRAALDALSRRARLTELTKPQPWKLSEADATLETPEGRRINLSDTDLAILRCFARHGGKADRAMLVAMLWGPQAGAMDNALHATLYRLRKRIEQAGQSQAPVHAVAKVGYEFRAPLVVVEQIGASGPVSVKSRGT